MEKKCVNLRGEEYEPMITGTNCPVSLAVLEQWYWEDGLSCRKIAAKILAVYQVPLDGSQISYFFKKNNIQKRTRRQLYTQGLAKIIKTKEHRLRGLDAMNALVSTYETVELQKRAAHARKFKKKVKHYSKPCDYCGKELEKAPPSRWNRSTTHFCNRSCRMHYHSTHRRPAQPFIGMSCPKCFAEELFSSGTNGNFKKFYCGICHEYSIQPIMERSLRQDLEAAGALDDGRILASAFQKPQESTEE